MPTTPRNAHRYAIYYTPNPGTLGWLAGSHWLGRCAASLQPLQQLDIHGVAAADLYRLTAAPRRHGWHATLRAPFALAPGTSWLELHHAVQQLAQGLAPFALPPLQVERIRDFLALVPLASHPAHAALAAVATACVQQLGPLAAPLAADELAGRCAGLTPRQQTLLQRWGHPFVLDEYQFHLPLTGSLALVDAATAELVLDAAQQYFSDLPLLTFDSLALFAEPTPGADLVLLDHLELGA